MSVVLAVVGLVVVPAIGLTVPGAAIAQAPPQLPRLDAEIRRLLDSSGASVGIGIRHLESGRELFVNGDQAFMMGSTFKLAVAAHLLALVDAGTERLGRTVPLLAADLFPSGSQLSVQYRGRADPAAELTLQRYLELMLIVSDNAATDVILRTVGGPAAVTARVRSLGITGLRVDRTVMEIYRDYVGLESLPPFDRRNVDTLTKMMAAIPPERLAAAQRAYHASEKDRATPRAMLQLLGAIWGGRALSSESRDLLFSIMRREETRTRIRGMLGPGIAVANKTGTYGTVVVNDVGIVYLPAGAGHLALAVFNEDLRSSEAAKERLIAGVARAAYDFFVFTAPAP